MAIQAIGSVALNMFKMFFLISCVAANVIYSMDDEKNSQFCAASNLMAENTYKTPHAVIYNYFFAADKAKLWFSKERVDVSGGVTKIVCDALECATLPLQMPQNMAAQYKQFLSNYGDCSYATQSASSLLAGFSNGSIFIQDQRTNRIDFIEQQEEAPLYGKGVTVCCFSDVNSYNPLTGVSAVLAAFTDKSLWLLDRQQGIKMTSIGTLPFCVEFLINGHIPNIWLASGENHVAIIQNNACTEPGATAWTAYRVGSPITGLMPYQCGIVYKTNQECALILPYARPDYEMIFNNSFESKQSACITRLIGQVALGMKPALIRGEYKYFRALPKAIQALLLQHKD